MSKGGRDRRPSDRDLTSPRDDAIRRARETADADIRELQQRLAATRAQLEHERAEREGIASELARLRRRRSVRAALVAARTLRPVLRLQHRLPRGWSSRRRLRPGARSVRSGDEDFAGNPFAAQLAAHFGVQALEAAGLDPSKKSVRAQPWQSSLRDGPLVSVVMVVDDTAEAVERCVQSVLEQTYCRWELIVRACARGDRLASLLPHHDLRVAVASLRSLDVGAARNSGLAAAGGELIAYLDPPNLWHPCFLERLVAALSTDHARYAVFCGHFDARFAGGQAQHVQQAMPLSRAEDPHADYAELVAQRAVELNAVVHRRELYDEIGGATKDARIGHDRDLLLKYLFVREPRSVDAPLLLRQQTTTRRPPPAEVALPKVVDLRESGERYFRDQLPRCSERRRPALTVVGGTGELAHEKAWDLAAALSTATSTQLISVSCGDGPRYAPRFLPAAETEVLALEGGTFPGLASKLAQGVANVHGDVVYAAEPRLPSLGLALLASYHHGTPILADLSHPPMIQRDGGKPHVASQDPLALEEVDAASPELIDPYSDMWDRLLAGVVQTLPARAVGCLSGGVAAPGSLVVHHPKDEVVFQPASHDRDLARQRLGLGTNERVVLCSLPDASGRDEQRAHVLDALAARFRLLVLDGAGSESSARDGRPTVDRADEQGMAAALAASDALLLWLDPWTALAEPPLPPELGAALAMQVPVLANDVGELGALAHDGYIGFVPFGDVEALAGCLEVLADPQRHQAQVVAGRHLFMRQLSHAAARVNLGVVLRVVARDGSAAEPAERFARFFAAFYRHLDRWAKSAG
jgi:hypothetical protein